MTKALRITSIIVAAAAVLLIALPAVFSSGMDEQARSLLNTPGVLESLQKSAASTDVGTVSPLVQQAEKFAKLLNPEPSPRPITPPRRTNRTTTVRPEAVSAKFELLGTSYYQIRPELSLALIDEPGKGLRWIRQSSEIGHLVVQEILDGKIVIRDGTNTYELEPKRVAKKSLVKGESIFTTEASSSLTLLPTTENASPPRRTSSRISPRHSRIPARTPEPQQNEAFTAGQTALLEQFTKETEDIDDPNEWLKKADEFMEQMAKASEVTDDEAAMLDELGQELQDANEEANEP